jgi:hypothetical protein
MAARPMTGFWDSLTPEQQAKALAFEGPEFLGPDGDEFRLKPKRKPDDREEVSVR